MMTPSNEPAPAGEPAAARESTDAWAPPVPRLSVAGVPSEAVNLNVAGRRLVGPFQGFGQLWQKTYWVRLSGAAVTPPDVISAWKRHFSEFWPAGNRLFPSLTGIAPGEVAVINLAVMPGGVPLSTGIMVLYADDVSFTFMNPEGHMFAGWITFSAREEEGATVAQVEVLIRANDPIWELAMRLFGFHKEDAFWHATLRSLAAFFGVAGDVRQQTTLVDPRVQWSRAGNVWHNAAIRSTLYFLAAPWRLIRYRQAHQRAAAGRRRPAAAPGGVRAPAPAGPAPVPGFGQLWQQTYRVRLPGAAVTPAELIQMWREYWPDFQPPQRRHYPALAGLQPGAVLPPAADAPGGDRARIVLLDAEAESFTLLLADGLPETGWIIFSAGVEEGCTVAQVETWTRARTLVAELTGRLTGGGDQERFWTYMLTALAARAGVHGQVQHSATCIDPGWRWKWPP